MDQFAGQALAVEDANALFLAQDLRRFFISGCIAVTLSSAQTSARQHSTGSVPHPPRGGLRQVLHHLS